MTAIWKPRSRTDVAGARATDATCSCVSSDDRVRTGSPESRPSSCPVVVAA